MSIEIDTLCIIILSNGYFGHFISKLYETLDIISTQKFPLFSTSHKLIPYRFSYTALRETFLSFGQ